VHHLYQIFRSQKWYWILVFFILSLLPPWSPRVIDQGIEIIAFICTVFTITYFCTLMPVHMTLRQTLRENAISYTKTGIIPTFSCWCKILFTCHRDPPAIVSLKLQHFSCNSCTITTVTELLYIMSSVIKFSDCIGAAAVPTDQSALFSGNQRCTKARKYWRTSCVGETQLSDIASPKNFWNRNVTNLMLVKIKIWCLLHSHLTRATNYLKYYGWIDSWRKRYHTVQICNILLG